MARGKADATLVIGADGSRARAEVDSVRTALDGAAASGSVFGNGLSENQTRVEKFSTAVTGASSVLGGLGSQVGATAGFLSNMGSAVMAGGPLLGGLAALAVVSTSVFSEMKKGKEETKAFAASLRELAVTAADEVAATIETASASVRDLRSEMETQFLKRPGNDSRLTAIEAERRYLVKQDDAAAMAILRSGRNLRAASGGVAAAKRAVALAKNEDESFKAKDKLKSAERLVDTIKSEISLSEGLIRQYQQQAAILDEKKGIVVEIVSMEVRAEQKALAAKNRAEQKAKAEAASKKRGSIEGGSSEDIALGNAQFLTRIKLEARAEGDKRTRAEAQAKVDALARQQNHTSKIVEQQKFEDARVAANARAEKTITDRKKRELKKRQEEAERQAAKEGNFRKEIAAEVASFSLSVYQTGFGALMTIVENGIKRQKTDYIDLFASVVKGIGQQVMATGVKYAVEGAGMLAFSGGFDPRGAATLAVGLGALATGSAMVATGTVVGAAHSYAQSKTESSGGTLAGGRLAPRGSGAGVGESQATIVQNFNGSTILGDPTDTSKTMAVAARRGNRELSLLGRVGA